MEEVVTDHRAIWSDARKMSAVPDNGVDLVVTSPPYPMIAMWDAILGNQRAAIKKALKKGSGFAAFEAMHALLDEVWTEVFRILKPGRFACINIGDATRTIADEFALYPNHARILSKLIALGFTPLPDILWRKQTNAPNKFMGSGMLPAGAYVTLEHEYILVVRKGGKREFSDPKQKQLRRESAFFWEERNLWFSDIWFDIKGSRQALGDSHLRKRSAAFPFELPYRLINMYSMKQDTVLDPFLGTGTTLWAAMAAGRNSVGFDMDPNFETGVFANLPAIRNAANQKTAQRLKAHRQFIAARLDDNYKFKHTNAHFGFPVMTAQEKDLRFDEITGLRPVRPNTVQVTYCPWEPNHDDAHELSDLPGTPQQQSLFSK